MLKRHVIINEQNLNRLRFSKQQAIKMHSAISFKHKPDTRENKKITTVTIPLNMH